MQDEQPSGSSTGGRRRGTRGGRGRRTKTSADAPAQDGDASVSDEPRVVRRRPAAAKAGGEATAAEKTDEKKSADGAAKRPSRRRRTAAKPAEEQAEAAAETTAVAPETAEEEPPKRRRTRRSTAKTADASDSPPADIAALGEAMVEMRQAVEVLTERVERATQRARLGIFVDVPNVLYGAERDESRFDMGKLLDYLADGRELVRATAYSPVSDDPSEPVERQRFVAPFVPHGYRIVTKPLKRFADGSIKGNFDVEMAIDMLTMAERLDVIACVSGDADFARLVEVIQGRGVRVEVVAFAGSTSAEMRALADRYIDLGAIIGQLLTD